MTASNALQYCCNVVLFYSFLVVIVGNRNLETDKILLNEKRLKWPHLAGFASDYDVNSAGIHHLSSSLKVPNLDAEIKV